MQQVRCQTTGTMEPQAVESTTGRLAGLNQRCPTLGHQVDSFGTTSTVTAALESVERRPIGGGTKDSFFSGRDVKALCKAGRLNEALHILDLMGRRGTRVYSNTFICLLQGCIGLKALAEGKLVHDHIVKNGFESDAFVGSTLISMYAKCGSVADARIVFDKIPKRDVVLWNTMIAGYSLHGHGDKSLQLFWQMQQESVKPDKVTFASILKACAHLASLKHGKQIHSHIIKNDFQSDAFVGNSLVDMYSKCGSVVHAREVFDQMSKQDVVSWNAMIGGYAQHGPGEEALTLFGQMQQESVKPNKVTFICGLKACAHLAALEQGMKIHAHIVKSGIESDVFVGNTLVDMYAKCGSIEHALQVFKTMPKRTVVSWTVLIAGYTQHGHGEEALKLFWQMHQECVMPNEVTFISVVKACACVAALEQGKQIHAHIINSGFDSDAYVGSALLDMYVKCGNIEHGRGVFDKMEVRDMILWNVMIAAYTQYGHGKDALKLFWQMQEEGVRPDSVTFVRILNACASLASLEEGKHIHALIVERGFGLDVFVGSALVDMYAKCGSIKHARQVFDKMPTQDLVLWTVMISGYVQHGHGKEALKLFWEMQQGSVKLDKVTFISCINACAIVAALEHGKQIHAQIIKSGFESDNVVGNSLIDMYTKCGSMELARQVFNNVLERDVVTWTSMISGYFQHRQSVEALKLFWQMQQGSVRPNKVTFIIALNACTALSALEQGKQIHGHIVESGFESDIFVGNTLLGMYAKCGGIEHASQVFDKMPKRDLVSWNAMLAGYAQHGHGRDAIQLVETMQREGMKLDQITFTALLSSCSHSGLLDEGRCYFDSMYSVHGITPTAEHYACMVDLLGRAGHVEEANSFIKKIPFQPTAVVWMALLSACRIYGHAELASCAAEYVLKLEPRNAAAFVLLSNIYAATGRWNDKAKVRRMMEDRCVKKEPGQSCILVNNEVHVFVVEDTAHPQIKEIHLELKRLFMQMTEAGYMPDTCFALHDVEEERKEISLWHHSEKLAIAFGLISIPAGTPIHIIKNLRVCGDCHTATKFISKIAEREIVLRDSSRFHHFKDGVCSCGDYW